MAINCKEFNQPLLKKGIDPGKCYLHFKPSHLRQMKAVRWFHIFIKTIKAETHCIEVAKAENISPCSSSFGEVGEIQIPIILQEGTTVFNSVWKKPHRSPLNPATPSRQLPCQACWWGWNKNEKLGDTHTKWHVPFLGWSKASSIFKNLKRLPKNTAFINRASKTSRKRNCHLSPIWGWPYSVQATVERGITFFA